MKVTGMIGKITTAVAVVALCALVVGAAKGTNRPLKGSLSGAAMVEFGVADCVPVNGVGMKTTTVGCGNVSHLGNVQALFTHCPGPLEGGATKNGRLTLCAANHDELWATYEDEDSLSPFVVHFAGGTGRFKDAEGTATVVWSVQWMFDEDGNLDFSVPWPFWATIDGTITY